MSWGSRWQYMNGRRGHLAALMDYIMCNHAHCPLCCGDALIIAPYIRCSIPHPTRFFHPIPIKSNTIRPPKAPRCYIHPQIVHCMQCESVHWWGSCAFLFCVQCMNYIKNAGQISAQHSTNASVWHHSILIILCGEPQILKNTCFRFFQMSLQRWSQDFPQKITIFTTISVKCFLPETWLLQDFPDITD